LRNHGRASLLDRRGVFVLFVDIVCASRIAAMRMHFADGIGGDVVAGSGLMRVACIIFGSAPGVFACVLRRWVRGLVCRICVEVGLFVKGVPHASLTL
jgi:hypothetical protein